MEPGSNPTTYPISVNDSDYNYQAYQYGATALYSQLALVDFSKVQTHQKTVT